MKGGPYCSNNFLLNGTKRDLSSRDNSYCKYTSLILVSVVQGYKLENDSHRNYLNINLNPDFLTVYVSQPSQISNRLHLLEAQGAMEVEGVIKMQTEDVDADEDAHKLVSALLDSGCLIGDCVSKN